MKKKPRKKKGSTLTIRLDYENTSKLEICKKLTYEKTGAGAITKMLEQYPAQQKEIIRLTSLANQLHTKYEIETNKGLMMKRAIENFFPLPVKPKKRK